MTKSGLGRGWTCGSLTTTASISGRRVVAFGRPQRRATAVRHARSNDLGVSPGESFAVLAPQAIVQTEKRELDRRQDIVTPTSLYIAARMGVLHRQTICKPLSE